MYSFVGLVINEGRHQKDEHLFYIFFVFCVFFVSCMCYNINWLVCNFVSELCFVVGVLALQKSKCCHDNSLYSRY